MSHPITSVDEENLLPEDVIVKEDKDEYDERLDDTNPFLQ